MRIIDRSLCEAYLYLGRLVSVESLTSDRQRDYLLFLAAGTSNSTLPLGFFPLSLLTPSKRYLLFHLLWWCADGLSFCTASNSLTNSHTCEWAPHCWPKVEDGKFLPLMRKEAEFSFLRTWKAMGNIYGLFGQGFGGWEPLPILKKSVKTFVNCDLFIFNQI